MSRKLRVATYYRVSKKALNGIRLQKKTCVDYCLKRKVSIAKEYIDRGFSGKSKNRPALKRMLEDIKSNKIDRVLVYKVDRLGRDYSYLNCLIETFENANVKFISATQDFDYSTPEGKFILRLFTILAEFESEMNSLRIKDGLRAAKKD